MNDKKIIFSTGEIIYDKEWYIKNNLTMKPIKYTSQFLKEIASNTMGSSLELSHGNNTIDAIGYVNNFDFVDDDLVANVTTDESLNDMGFSPEFSANFIDRGECYEAIDGKLLKTILTDAPRSKILCNSVEGGSNMNEELIETLNKQIKDLNRQVAQKEAIIDANKKKLDEYEELLSEKQNLEKDKIKLENDIEEYKNQINGLTPKAEAYAKIEESRKDDLLTKAFGDDEEAKKTWKDASMEQLESLANHREITKQANGIGSANAEGLGEGDSTDDEPNNADKALEFYKKTHNGEEPTFLKQQGGQ